MNPTYLQVMQPKKAKTIRHTTIGMQVVFIDQTMSQEDQIAYLDREMRERKQYLEEQFIRECSFYQAAHDTVMVHFRASKQLYWNAWATIVNKAFDARRVIYVLNDGQVETIKKLFMERRKVNPTSIHTTTIQSPMMPVSMARMPVAQMPVPQMPVAQMMQMPVNQFMHIPAPIIPAPIIPAPSHQVWNYGAPGSHNVLQDSVYQLPGISLFPPAPTTLPAIQDFKLPGLKSISPTPSNGSNPTFEVAESRKRDREIQDDDGSTQVTQAAQATEPPRPTKIQAENPFQLKDNHEKQLTDFMHQAKPWNNPGRFRDIRADEQPSAYKYEKKVSERVPTAINQALILLVPSIVRRSRCKDLLKLDPSCQTSGLSESHVEILDKLFAQFHYNDWRGIYALLQRPNMSCTTYNFSTSKPLHRSLNFVEAHRRVIRMEQDVHRLASYLEASITAGHRALRSIAPNHLAAAYSILMHLNPTSTAMDRIFPILPSPPSAVIPQLTEELIWLKTNRASALERHSPYLTELDWGLSWIATLHGLKPSMLRLDDELEAQSVLMSIMQYSDRRTTVYCKDIEHLLHYGGRLTRFTTDLQFLCQCFKGLGQVPFTTAGRFHELNVKGELVGPNGRAIPSGLHGQSNQLPGREDWILPFPVECIDIVPDKDAQRLCEQLAEEDRLSISRMLVALAGGIPISSVPPILTYTAAGHAFVKQALENDTFELNLTSVLPPSASLPAAWYEPDVVFKIE